MCVRLYFEKEYDLTQTWHTYVLKQGGDFRKVKTLLNDPSCVLVPVRVFSVVLKLSSIEKRLQERTLVLVRQDMTLGMRR
jgi:hypothetical protein